MPGIKYAKILIFLYNRKVSIRQINREFNINESHLRKVFRHLIQKKIIKFEKEKWMIRYSLTQYGEDIVKHLSKLIETIEKGDI